ncbi:extracellular solute-binding protein [Paenibacillus sp. J5C_2022]|uniref:extracellular solute-binding protein n=1 Tax=Paenibacillus sp. J5C2022 TaxID=2977129 RepID=UPI0021D2E211|nr:extracellular solute-binding protein [Paenibacillus sp. J5C2022]MCU6712571.1 extracellular solute-binding protein [Paenibacillus sp. J5C2022]
MKHSSKVSLVLLLVIMVFLSACSSGNNDPDNETVKQTEASPEKDKETDTEPIAKSAPTGLPEKYDPPIELTTVTTTAGWIKYPEGEDADHNVWIRMLEEEYGISVKHLWTADGGSYPEKINLAIASGQLPDFFWVGGDQLQQLADADLIEDLTDVYKNYAPKVITDVMDEAGPLVLESATINGKLMAIPWTGFNQENVPMVWVRDDWRTNLNLPEPKTMEDLLAISEAFTTQDPDNNGIDDTYGIGMDKDFGSIQGFLNGYHAYRNIWIEDGNGGLKYSSIQPEMKDALAKLQQMYATKQIDPEFGVKSSSKYYEDIGTNKLGIVYRIRSASALQSQTPTAEWRPYVSPSIDNNPAKMQHELNVSGYWVVKKGTKNPEAVLKMAELFMNAFYFNTSDEVFERLVDDKNGHGAIYTFAPVEIYRPFNNYNGYLEIQKFKNGEVKLEDLTPLYRNFYNGLKDYEDGNKEAWNQNAANGPLGSGYVLGEYIKNDQFMPNQFTTTPTPTMISKLPNLLDMELEMMTKIVTGGPLSEFDKFVDNWNKLGGKEIEAEVNEWYQNK